MILEKKLMMLAEVREIVSKLDEKQELKDYLKKFTKLKKEKADKLAKEIKDLDNPKINEDSLVKIVDFLPRTKEDLSKIMTEVSLSEEETNAILEIVKKY